LILYESVFFSSRSPEFSIDPEPANAGLKDSLAVPEILKRPNGTILG
jgi:hypothetical protein